jgi:hypothetical protein
MKAIRQTEGTEMFRTTLAALFALAIGLSVCFAAPAGSDDASISQLLHSMFDKPHEPLSVEPIMVSGNHAIADWVQGEMGGRALLRSQRGIWAIVLCAGDSIKSRDALLKAGVPLADAERLASDLATAEAKLPPEKSAMFSRFDGLVMINGDTNHQIHDGK